MLRRGGFQKPLDNTLNFRVRKQAESQCFSGVPWVMTFWDSLYRCLLVTMLLRGTLGYDLLLPPFN